jgi:HEPN domain-containing protein
MKPLTLEWVEKGEDDFATMSREFRASGRPNYAGVCFHAQQCVEKLLKGFLFEHDIEFAKTHDIRLLINLSSELQPEWVNDLEPAMQLTNYAVEVRYPGNIATKTMAANAIGICRSLREKILAALDLPSELPFE